MSISALKDKFNSLTLESEIIGIIEEIIIVNAITFMDFVPIQL